MFFKNPDYAAGWLAGIIDGEGCVSRTGIKQRAIQISNTDNEILRSIEEVLSMFGVRYCINTTKNHEYNPKHTKAYCIRIGTRDGLEKLNAILNLASIKKQERLRWIVTEFSKNPPPVEIDWREVVDLYLSGALVKDIATKYGVSSNRIDLILDRCSIARRTIFDALSIAGLRRRKYGAVESALVAEYKSGVSLEDSAKKFGIPKSTASMILERHGAQISRSDSNKRSWAKRDMEKWKSAIGSANREYWKNRRQSKIAEMQARN